MRSVHGARKRFGQHFLSDLSVCQAIVQAISPQRQDNMLEIGPGLGALTQQILPFLDRLQVIEIDRDLAAALRAQQDPRLVIHEGDVLRFDLSSLFASQALRVFGNLPYNISTPLLFHLLSYLPHIRDMHFMLQKEVVDRLCAQPGHGDFGRLSVMIQYHCQTQYLFNVPPTAFRPPPKVMSSVVRLIPHSDASAPPRARDVALLSKVVMMAFQYRRKTLKNALKNLVSPKQFEAALIEPTRRPETLSVTEFVTLSNQLDPY